MADRTPLRTADRNAISNAISDDDPFAELTRIMGFDPRQPVQARQDPVMADSDFEIDLEKELMGEFSVEADDDFSPEQNAQNAQGAYEAPAVSHGHLPARDLPAHDLDQTVAASMQDFDLDMSGEAAQPAAPEIGFEDDFEDALAQSFDAEPQWPEETENPA
ncbi:MAG TPA: hypothetical protein VGM46_09260, partial [Mesorhizobium sp.]